MRETIPIFLGAEGPKNVALCAELCDGWLALFFSPRNEGFYRDALAEGFARDGARRSFDDFEVCATVPFIVHDDVEAAADMLRPMYALYFGGMGARGANFHHDVAVRLGYEAEAKRCQDLYLDGRKDEAGRRAADEARRGARAHRPARQDPPRPRGLARVDRHDDARRGIARDAARRGRARARLARGRLGARVGRAELHRERLARRAACPAGRTCPSRMTSFSYFGCAWPGETSTDSRRSNW